MLVKWAPDILETLPFSGHMSYPRGTQAYSVCTLRMYDSRTQWDVHGIIIAGLCKHALCMTISLTCVCGHNAGRQLCLMSLDLIFQVLN